MTPIAKQILKTRTVLDRTGRELPLHISRLLRVGDVVIFDDCTGQGVKKMVRYISQWSHLEVYGRHFEYENRASKKSRRN